MLKKEKIIIYLDRAIEVSLYAFIFTLPFSKSMMEIFFILALICWIIKRSSNYTYTLHATRYTLKDRIIGLIKAFKPIATKLNLPIGVFILIGFFSVINSVSLSLSLEGFFFKLFEWVMIFFLVAETINSKRKLDRMLIVIFSSMVLIGIDGIFQFITDTDFIRHYVIDTRLQASFRSPNSFAGWLVIMIPLALSVAYFSMKMRVSKTIKSILWIIVGVFIFCLALTQTRGAWIAVILSLVFLGIFGNKRLFIIIIAALLILAFVIPDFIKKRISSISETSICRSKLWQEALGIIEDFPVFGSGLNTYAIVGPYYKITEETGFYPHNSYLHMAAESGLLGVGTFIWIMIALFRASLANLKRIQNRFHNALLIGLLAGLFGFLVHSFVDVNFYTLQLGNLMWFIAGLIIAVQNVSLQNGKNNAY